MRPCPQTPPSPWSSSSTTAAWQAYRSAAFIERFAAACVAAGVAVVPLRRTEGGICSADESKQLRFPLGKTRFLSSCEHTAHDIELKPRPRVSSGWILADLLLIRDAFVATMHADLGEGSVRARLFAVLEKA